MKSWVISTVRLLSVNMLWRNASTCPTRAWVKCLQQQELKETMHAWLREYLLESNHYIFPQCQKLLSPVPPHQTSFCPAPGGSGTHTPLMTHGSLHALFPGAHQPVGNPVKSNLRKNSQFDISLRSWLYFNWPLEAGSLSSWQKDSSFCLTGCNIFHSLSQTSFSFPARQIVKIKDIIWDRNKLHNFWQLHSRFLSKVRKTNYVICKSA